MNNELDNMLNTIRQKEEQCHKLEEAGIQYRVTFLNGVAGREHSHEHAVNSASHYQCQGYRHQKWQEEGYHFAIESNSP